MVHDFELYLSMLSPVCCNRELDIHIFVIRIFQMKIGFHQSFSLLFTRINCFSTFQDEDNVDWEIFCRNNSFRRSEKLQQDGGKRYLITWYNVSPYIKYRPIALGRRFEPCKYKNCELSLCRETAEESDVVIFNGRRLPERYKYTRRSGQIWVFAEDETPHTYDYDGGHWKSKFWRSAFNWTMTYDKEITDIYLPSGELWKKKKTDNRDFTRIAKQKTRQALLISSHCTTESKRTEYVEQLRKYVDVDILGTCGRKWDCGKAWIHDDCFRILNSTYKFYLAFENALCRGYRTEKFFENFNYDIILVARGGISKEDILEPKDVYISTSDFSDIESLGKYLEKLSTNTSQYASFLASKSQYYFPGFHESYQTALCSLCEKVNNQEKNHREIHDLVEHVRASSSCAEPTDVKVNSWIYDWLFGWYFKKW